VKDREQNLKKLYLHYNTEWMVLLIDFYEITERLYVGGVEARENLRSGLFFTYSLGNM